MSSPASHRYFLLLLLGLLISQSAPGAITVLDYYRLGEADAGAVYGAQLNTNSTDSVGTKHLARIGSPVYTNQVAPAAVLRTGSQVSVHFSGNGQGLSNSVLTTVVDDFGMEAWIRPSSATGGRVVAYNGHTATSGWGIYQSGTNCGVLYGGVVIFGATPLPTNNWAHVALVRAGETARLYVNGISVATNTDIPHVPVGGFCIAMPGQGAVNENFVGQIDEVRVFTFAAGQFSTNDLLLNKPAASAYVMTMNDSLQNDVNGNGRPNPGDVLRYTVIITNSTGGTLSNAVFDSAFVRNTLGIEGSLRVTPLARADGPASNSVPGNAFHGAMNTLLNIPAGSGLLANDFIGLPAAQILSFGGGAFGATVTANAAGTTATNPAVGGLTVNADGSVAFTPIAAFAGITTFQYRLGNALGTNDATVTLAIGNRPVASNDTYFVTGNTMIDSSLIPRSLLANDSGDGIGISGIANPAFGTFTLGSGGNFLFTPNPGFTGSGNANYTLTNGFGPVQGLITLIVSNRLWYVDNSAPVNGDGRSSSPFKNTSDFSAVNDGAANRPGNGDPILLRQGSATYTGGVVLRSGQKLYGDGTPGSLVGALGFSLTPGSVSSPGVPVPEFTGVRPSLVITGNGVSLNADNTVRGLNLTVNSGRGFFGTSVGNLSINNVAVSAAGFRVLSLENGSVDVTLDSITSTFSSEGGVRLSGLAGTVVINGGSINNAVGNAFEVIGGTVDVTYSGGMSQNFSPLISVTGGHSGGTINFNSGTLSSSGNQGLFFNNADGTYNFNGPTILNGGSSTILITNDSAGTFYFSHATTINNSSATPAFKVSGGTASVNFHGGITNNGAGSLVTVSGGHSGMISFENNFLEATSGNGLQFDNADGGYSFYSTVKLNGGDAGIDITNGSSGSFTFSDAPITNPTGVGFRVIGGSANIDHSGAISKSSSGQLVDIQGRTGGVISLYGTLTASGSASGIQVQNCTGGSIIFAGPSKSLTTGANAPVNLVNNAGATIRFENGSLTISSTTTGFNATGGAVEISVIGGGNTINSGPATALNVVNSTIGLVGLEFQSISSSGGSATGIILDNTGSSGGLKVTGTGVAASGGTIANKTGADGSTTTGIGIYLNNTTGVQLNRIQLNDFQNYAIRGLGVNGFVLNNSVVNATGTNKNGNNLGVDEGSVVFGVKAGTTGLTGVAGVTNSVIEDGAEDSFGVYNASGTLNLTMQNISVSGSGNDGVVAELHSTATVNVDVRSSLFSANRGDHFDAKANGSANLNVQFGNNGGNILTNGNLANPLGLSLGIQTGGQWSGSGSANIANNTIVGAFDTPINVNIGGPGTFNAIVDNNVIGTSGVAGSGSIGNEDAIRIVANGDKGALGANANGGTLTARVSNNTLQQVSGRGIYVLGRDGGSAGDPIELNITITGNIFRQSSASTGQGIRIESGASSTPTPDHVKVHADIGGAGAAVNVFQDDWGVSNVDGIDYDEIRIAHSITGGNQFILTGYAGSGTSTAQVGAYLAGRNTVGAGGVASASIGGGNSYGTGGTPPQP